MRADKSLKEQIEGIKLLMEQRLRQCEEILGKKDPVKSV
jgi:hypothetical protein